MALNRPRCTSRKSRKHSSQNTRAVCALTSARRTPTCKCRFCCVYGPKGVGNKDLLLLLPTTRYERHCPFATSVADGDAAAVAVTWPGRRRATSTSVPVPTTSSTSRTTTHTRSVSACTDNPHFLLHVHVI